MTRPQSHERASRGCLHWQGIVTLFLQYDPLNAVRLPYEAGSKTCPTTADIPSQARIARAGFAGALLRSLDEPDASLARNVPRARKGGRLGARAICSSPG
jgi:hypothetical protein